MDGLDDFDDLEEEKTVLDSVEGALSEEGHSDLFDDDAAEEKG